jgi:outer membrane lipoprotein LolB
MRGRCAGLAILLLMAGCVTPPAPRTLLSPEAQTRLLQMLPGFTLQGRAAVTAAGEGFNATLFWRQQGTDTALKLGGPIGAGSLTLQFEPGTLRLTTSRGEVLDGTAAEDALVGQLGFLPPFEALRYWVLGLPAPGEAPASVVEAAPGRIAELTQQQWLIRYERWMQVATREGMAQLPQRLTATRADLRLRVVVDRWRL